MSTAGGDDEGTVLQRLARRIRAFSAAQVTPQALALARTAIIDTLGVTLAGSAEPAATLLTRVPGVMTGPTGPCTVFGTALKASALDATFINGAASHALDYDDFSQPMGGHQSVPLVAALMAVAEERGLSGSQLITSYVLGIEVEIRLARAVNFHHYDKGWHPTATLGVFGAAAAVGHLIGLDEAKLAVALAIAASSASGVKANFGTMVKPLHVGQCARNGLMVALLAEAGYDANPAALEHPQGFLNAYNGAGQHDARQIFEHWVAPLEVLSPSMGLKQFPCCGSTHPAIAAMLVLRQQHGLRPEDVRRVEILPHRRRLPHTDNPDPRTPLAAKFSVQYAVARALVDGAVRLEHFEGEAPHDPRVRAVMALTSAAPHPDMADDAADQFNAEVRVTLADGRVLAHRIDGLVGRGGENPLSSAELWEKFNDCARRGVSRHDVMPLFERLESLETVKDLRQVTRLLARRGLPGAGVRAAGEAPRQPVFGGADPAPGDAKSGTGRGNTLQETSWVP